MARKYIDCSEFPSESKCTVAISAASEKDVNAAVKQNDVCRKIRSPGDETKSEQ
jgi:hypothetical protein